MLMGTKLAAEPPRPVLTASDSPTSLACAQRVITRIVVQRHDRPSLVAKIACEIGAEIIQGLFLPGDDLNSIVLSRRFKTSRTPIREALVLLENEGLVDIPPRRRPRVKVMEIDEIKDIYEARAALFSLMGQAVALNASEDEIARLDGPLEELRRHHGNHDLEGFLWANVDLYDLITELAKNRTVRAVVDSLLLRTLTLRRLSLSLPGRMNSSLDDATRLVRAFQQRDAILAAALIRSNHINALTSLSAHFSALDQGMNLDGTARAAGSSPSGN
jgi:DNA-binding GntR family transcriptional regulator